MEKKSKKDYLIIGSLLFLGTVPGIAGVYRLSQLFTGENINIDNKRFFDDPIPAIVHIIAVLVFSLVGAFQFSERIRLKHLMWHRISGRMLVPVGIISAISGIWLTVTYPKVPTDGEWLYSIRLIVGVWMIICMLLGFIFILKKKVTTHSHWMIRGYAIGMGAGTQVFTHLPYFILIGGDPSGIVRDLMMGAGWFINFIIAEWIIWMDKKKII